MAQKRTTIRDVAKAAGISASAVSMALRNDARISQETKDRVLKIADKMGYRPNPMVAALMSQVKKKNVINDSKLALIGPHGNHHFLMTHDHAYGRNMVEAMRARAEELGYGGIDVFEAEEDKTDLNHLAKVISNRGIKGALLPPFIGNEHVEAEFQLDFSDFAVVAAGYSQKIQGLHRVTHDQYQIAFRTTDKALSRGYKKIGLLINRYYEERTGWHHTGGYAGAILRHPNAWSNRKAIFYRDDVPYESLYNEVLKWMDKHQFDCILCSNTNDYLELKEAGYKIPGDLGLALLNIPSDGSNDKTKLSGMFHNPAEVGRAAVDLLTAQINRNEFGRPSLPKTVMTRPTWIEGKSLPERG